MLPAMRGNDALVRLPVPVPVIRELRNLLAIVGWGHRPINGRAPRSAAELAVRLPKS